MDSEQEIKNENARAKESYSAEHLQRRVRDYRDEEFINELERKFVTEGNDEEEACSEDENNS